MRLSKQTLDEGVDGRPQIVGFGARIIVQQVPFTETTEVSLMIAWDRFCFLLIVIDCNQPSLTDSNAMMKLFVNLADLN